jgi:hypothetical protein
MIQSAYDVLRVIYGGFDHDGHFNCNGDVRRSMVANWASLTQTNGCATPTNPAGCSAGGLRHAWRRGDLDPVTIGFVSMVGFGSRAIGNSPFTGGPLLKQQNPFCNSMDANQPTPPFPVCGNSIFCPQNFACDQPTSNPPAGHCVWTNNNLSPGLCSATVACPAGFACDSSGHCSLSDGGMSDFSDNDPIRMPCLTPTTTPVGYDEVCSVDLSSPAKGSLGLVLPMFLPDTTAVTAADDYPTVDCDLAFYCDLVAPAPITRIPVGYLCPDGQPLILNRCWAPFHLSPTGTTYACRADKFWNHYCFGLPGGNKADGRVYNKAIIKPDLVRNLPGAYATDLNGRLMSGSFFRIRSGLNALTGTDPSPCNTATTEATQLACLSAIDTCTMSF